MTWPGVEGWVPGPPLRVDEGAAGSRGAGEPRGVGRTEERRGMRAEVGAGGGQGSGAVDLERAGAAARAQALALGPQAWEVMVRCGAGGGEPGEVCEEGLAPRAPLEGSTRTGLPPVPVPFGVQQGPYCVSVTRARDTSPSRPLGSAWAASGNGSALPAAEVLRPEPCTWWWAPWAWLCQPTRRAFSWGKQARQG